MLSVVVVIMMKIKLERAWTLGSTKLVHSSFVAFLWAQMSSKLNQDCWQYSIFLDNCKTKTTHFKFLPSIPLNIPFHEEWTSMRVVCVMIGH